MVQFQGGVTKSMAWCKIAVSPLITHSRYLRGLSHRNIGSKFLRCPDSKLRWPQVGPTWILSAPRWANVGPTCLAILVGTFLLLQSICHSLNHAQFCRLECGDTNSDSLVIGHIRIQIEIFWLSYNIFLRKNAFENFVGKITKNSSSHNCARNIHLLQVAISSLILIHPLKFGND